MKGKKMPNLLKRIIAAFSSKSNELRVRIMIFFLLHKNMDKSSLAHSFSQNLQTLVAPNHNPKKKHAKEEEEEEEGHASQLMYYHQVNGGGPYTKTFEEDEEEKEDLTRVLFEESKAAMEEEEGAAVEEVGEGMCGLDEVVKEVVEVREENVDHAADLFIKRFKRNMQLQKLHSLDKHAMALFSNS